MRLIAVLVLSAVLLTNRDSVLAASGSMMPARTANDVNKGEERTFVDDPAINKYLHRFQDWAKPKSIPEDLFTYYGLPEVMWKAYKSGKWKRLLDSRDYIMYRKYDKYLKIQDAGEGRTKMLPSLN